MKSVLFEDVLRGNSYPGRGVAIGQSEDGQSIITLSFIMGRSQNSRNRVYFYENGEVRTKAFDESLMEDPSLIIYSAVNMHGGGIIVTNGDQTTTIANYLTAGKTFEDALNTRTFEPDSPNFTPRISGFATGEGYKLSVLKAQNGNAKIPNRFYYNFGAYNRGHGHFIHTYSGFDGNRLTSFNGEPVHIKLCGNLEELAESVWNSLNAENKIALYVGFANIQNGENKILLYNKNGGKNLEQFNFKIRL